MNRIKLDVIKQTTSVPISQLSELTICNPYTQGWLSQKFPVYPIVINFHISNPPFNRISFCVCPPYLPGTIVFEGSSDGKQYFRVVSVDNWDQQQQPSTDKKPKQSSNLSVIIKSINLKEHHHYKYLRIKITPPKDPPSMNSKTNPCRQVWLKCIQLTFVTFYGAEYVCSLAKQLQLDPALFRILEILEYKALIAKDRSKKSTKAAQYIEISNKYYKDMEEVLNNLKEWKQSNRKLSTEARENILTTIEALIKQPLDVLDVQQIQYDRKGIKQEVETLQNQLQQFYVHRLNNLHKDVTDYFHKYWNREVKQQYMRLLSSPQTQDHGKALTNFWGQAKQLETFPEHIQQAVVMYFNYFLEYTHDPLKITAIKILCLLFRNPSLNFQIYFVYERLLFNLYSQLSSQQNEQLFNVSLKCIYTLFQKVPDNLYIQALLNPEHSVKFSMKIIKLQILQKLTFKQVTIGQIQRDNIIDYLLSILSLKQLKLEDKNRAYNIIAYLASIYTKELVMSKFEKLNAMITMSMEKIVDKKLSMMKGKGKQNENPGCEFCGIVKESFKDTNVYDLHCFKDCKYLTPCRYCNQIVEIPQLNKHYIHNCQQRNIFKQCQHCNEAIIKLKQDEHIKVCEKMLSTKCALCGQKMQGKLKLKEHILKDGCPNNPR